jgi:hypothetical protein
MKKTNLIVVAIFILLGGYFASCESSKDKVEDAQEEVKDAHEDLDKANKAYIEDVEKYRIATNERIAANNKALADLKATLGNKKDKAAYKLEVAELEAKNALLEKKIRDYKAIEQDKWEQFKSEFNHDLDGISEAFKDITVRNTK